MYQLKKGEEAFTVMTGPDAGKTYEKDAKYPAPPVGYETRFKEIKNQPAKEAETKATDATKRKGSKK